ncbi:MAG TPA: hypothetical protein ENF48_04835 [Desulfobacteraceae bacterium]|nr:hypothetical protein [Deltaproteobacteria bacterium]RLB98130.1 MAG: hypothetical protein DRH76_03335 [Deltaproteobacteria bacterium]HDI59674.1 hypothetical protein [Desulfobacteraceae bacterium]
MRIICLQRYRSGFRGFIEEPENWVMFQFFRRHGLRRLAVYPRSDFRDYAHFIGMMSRFVPANRFLPTPVTLNQPDLDGFERLWRTLAESDA